MKEYKGVWIPDDETHIQYWIDQGFDNYTKVLDLAVPFCLKREVALDIGANVGIMTNRLAESFNMVYSYEPEPTIFECLEHNVRARPNVRLGLYGLGAVRGMYLCGCPEMGNLGMTQLTRTKYDIYDTTPVELAVVETLDMQKLEPDFIKIDVEGMELQVLQGGIKTLVDYEPIVMLEVKGHGNRFNEDPFAPVAFLQNLGYQLLIKAPSDLVFCGPNHIRKMKDLKNAKV